MISRQQAVATVLSLLDDELLVTANGMISREAFAAGESPRNFYMIGSMGLASAIGLGVALARPERRIVVFDGDGNLLMALGSLAMVAERRPTNFLHLVFDNETYGSTGGQRSLSDHVALEELARAAGYARTARAVDEETLRHAAAELLAAPGPSFLLVKISPEERPGVPRVKPSPPEITERFRRAAGSVPEEAP